MSLRSVSLSFPIARRLFLRDIRARYRQSALGLLWIVLPAVAQTAIWLFLSASDIVNAGDTGVPYVAFVAIGTLLWQSFVEMLMSPGNQVANSIQMMARLNFPHEALFLAGLADGCVSLAARLAVTAPILAFARVDVGWAMLCAPLGGLALLILGLAIGLAIAPFSLLYHDVSRLLLVSTGFWLLVTPVAYVPPTAGPAAVVVRWNPVTPLVEQTRTWLTGGGVVPSAAFVAVVVGSGVLLVAAWLLFRLAAPHLIDRFGS